jgi:plasmid replication initiation protein
MAKKKYDAIPFKKDAILDRPIKLNPLEVRYGIFVLDKFYKNRKLALAKKTNDFIETKMVLLGKEQKVLGIRCSIEEVFEYMHDNPNYTKNFNNIDEAINKIQSEAWIKYHDDEKECTKPLVLSTIKYKYKKEYIDILIDAPLIISAIIDIENKKDGSVVFIPPWIYGKRYNLTRHQIRLYELYYLWRGNNNTCAVGYEYIQNFFGVSYKNMGAFRIGALDNAITKLKDRNILNVEIEQTKASKKIDGKYLYIIKFEVLKGGIK